MDPDTLKAFLAVAKSCSFTQAGKDLCLSQSAISKRIAQLEAKLACQLFDRIGHQIQLNHAGRILLPRAEQILFAISDCQQEINNLNDKVSGPLKITTSHHIGLHRLPDLLKQFKQRYQQVELNIRFQDSEQAYLEVERGETEIGIVTLPVGQNTSHQSKANLIYKTIWTDSLLPVAGKQHTLAKKSRLSLAQIIQHEAILPAKNTFTRLLIKNTLDKYGYKVTCSMETNYLETIKMLVSVGLGWSILPTTMIDKELKVLALPELQLRRQLGYVRHNGRSLSNAAKALIQLLENTINNSDSSKTRR